LTWPNGALLANQIASSFNELNQGYRVDKDGNYLDSDSKYVTHNGIILNQNDTLTPEQLVFLQGYAKIDDDGYYLNDNGDRIVDDNHDELNANTLTDYQRTYIQSLGEVDKLGGVLFSNNGDGNSTTKITASNISISYDWAYEKTHILTSCTETVAGQGIPTTASDNVDHFIALMDKKLSYIPHNVDDDAGNDPMFYGTFREMLTKISAVLANDQSSTQIRQENYYNASVELDTDRESVSGVDLNDEAMNMIQFQKAYSAACRMITVVDEALDKLINGTGVTGL
jgi:flagellar hook-associated protein 1 FlgK